MKTGRSHRTDNVIERRLAEGKGKGVGVDYKPWLQVEDTPAKIAPFLLKTSPLHSCGLLRYSQNPNAAFIRRRIYRLRRVAIIGSLFEHRAPGLYHNTAVVIDYLTAVNKQLNHT